MVIWVSITPNPRNESFAEKIPSVTADIPFLRTHVLVVESDGYISILVPCGAGLLKGKLKSGRK